MISAVTTLKTTVTITAPCTEVFAAFTDIPASADRIDAITRIEMLTDGLIGAGTRWRETRSLYGREATEVLTITDFQPPDRFVVTAETHGMRYDTIFRFHPCPCDPRDDPATKVDMTFQATPLTRAAKLLAILMRPLSRAMAKECARDLDDMKRAIEADRMITAPASA